MPTTRKLKAKPQPVAQAVGAALFHIERENAIMADSKQRLTNKINAIRQQIENDEMTLFQQQLIVDDLARLPKDAPKEMVDRLVGPKTVAELEIKLAQHRLASRKPLLEMLEAELKAIEAPAQQPATQPA